MEYISFIVFAAFLLLLVLNVVLPPLAGLVDLVLWVVTQKPMQGWYMEAQQLKSDFLPIYPEPFGSVDFGDAVLYTLFDLFYLVIGFFIISLLAVTGVLSWLIGGACLIMAARLAYEWFGE